MRKVSVVVLMTFLSAATFAVQEKKAGEKKGNKSQTSAGAEDRWDVGIVRQSQDCSTLSVRKTGGARENYRLKQLHEMDQWE